MQKLHAVQFETFKMTYQFFNTLNGLQFIFDKYENEISQNITSIRGPYEVCCCD